MAHCDLTKIACGCRHVFGITKSGSLVGWGCNLYGSLGTGHNRNFHELGRYEIFSKGVQEVAAGWGHALALMEDGSVWAWGVGDEGQLGLGTGIDCFLPKKIDISEISGTRIVSIGCGFTHSFFLTDYGKLYLFGCDKEGQVLFTEGSKLHPLEFPEMRFSLPKDMLERMWQIVQWIFLGKLQKNSFFFGLPIEVIFNFVGLQIGI
jgi:alpha-tubulin suppressor-like RCC1 family protein